MNTDFLILVYANVNLLSKERYHTMHFKAILYIILRFTIVLIFSAIFYFPNYSFLHFLNFLPWSCITFIINKKQILKEFFTSIVPSYWLLEPTICIVIM